MLRKRNNFRSGKKDENVEYTCTIRFLDDSEPMHVSFQRETKGQWLLDYICRELNLVEKDYFGLRFVDADKQRKAPLDELITTSCPEITIGDSKHLGIKEHWLDPLKPVYKQMKNVNPLVLCFRVKFYPPDPMVLREEITRYFLFLQLRRDLHHGRLLCSQTDASILAAYIIQSEVGDYDPTDHAPGYVSNFNMLPKQTPKMEEKIAEIHKSLAGEVPAESESNFLKKAASLDTYGVDPYQVKDQKGNQLYLGITHLGIVTFQGSKRSHLFRWPQVNRIAFEGKMFIVHITLQEKKKHAHGFKCQSYSACRQLWRVAVEQQAFFTLNKAVDAPKMSSGGGLFQRSCRFRFSGRSQKEVILESKNITRDPPIFVRSPSNAKYTHVDRSNSMPARMNRELTDSGYDTMNSQKEEYVILTDTRDSVLMDFVIPEDNAVAVSMPPQVAIVTVEAPVTLETVHEVESIPDVALLPVDEGIDEAEDEHIDEAQLDVMIDSTQLDAEIESLQKELHKINSVNAHETEHEVLVKTNGICHAEPDSNASKEVVVEAPVRRNRCCTVLKVVLTTLGIGLLAVILCTVLMIVFFEVKNDKLKNLYNHDAIKNFRYVYYDPARNLLVKKMATLMKK